MRAPAAFAVYYGWPGEVNGSGGDVAAAIEAFAGYREVVLGEGNVLPGADPSAAAVIAGLVRRRTFVFGYVDLGVTNGTRNWAADRLEELTQTWCALGAGGLFLDCAGRDYGVSARRLAYAVRLSRERRLRVLVNAWRPEEVLEPPTPLRRGDGYLAENAVMKEGRFVDEARFGAKLARLESYRAELGVRLYTTATTGQGPVPPGLVAELVRRCGRYRLDALAVSDTLYGSRDDGLLPARALGFG